LTERWCGCGKASWAVGSRLRIVSPEMLHCREMEGGRTAAVLMMSVCTTCKELGIDPQAYIRDVLDRVSTHPAKRIEELLPDRWQELRQAGAAA
jgi:hypothetical protein